MTEALERLRAIAQEGVRLERESRNTPPEFKQLLKQTMEIVDAVFYGGPIGGASKRLSLAMIDFFDEPTDANKRRIVRDALTERGATPLDNPQG